MFFSKCNSQLAIVLKKFPLYSFVQINDTLEEKLTGLMLTTRLDNFIPDANILILLRQMQVAIKIERLN